jgi:hypothetical protein
MSSPALVSHPEHLTPVTRDGYRDGETQRNEFILGTTGSFRNVIQEYLATVAPHAYKKKDLTTVRSSIGSFFKFVVHDLHIDDLDLIRTSTITRYIEYRSHLGYASHNFLGHLSSFFLWMTSTGRYDRGNPVVRRLHRESIAALKNSSPAKSCSK